MGTEATRTTAQLPPRQAESAPQITEQAGWRRAISWIADYELVFILIPVAAAILVNQVPWQWVVSSWLIIPLTWLTRRITWGYWTVQTPLNLPIVFLVFMTGVALYPSVDLSLTLPILTKTIAGVGLFYAIINSVRSEQVLWVLAGGVLVAGAGIAVISLGNTGWVTSKLFAAPDTYDRIPRFLGFLNPSGFNRNIVGGTSGMLLPFCLALVIAPPRDKLFNSDHVLVNRIFSPAGLQISAGLASLAVGGILLLSQSRGALAGVVVALLILAVWWSRWTITLVPVGVAGVLLAVQRFGLQNVVDFFLITDITPSSQGRLELWQRAVYMLQDFPYTGIGLGTFSRVTPVLYPLFLIGPDTEVPHAHNLYLQAGVDLGIPGLVARMAIISAFFLVGISAVRRTRHTVLEGVTIGALCGFVVYLVHGLVDNIAFSAKPAIVLWTLMGVSAAAWLSTGESSRRRETEDL